MKAITVKQPWASLIVEGIKDIENRTWKLPKKYIGERVLIHSSQKPLEFNGLGEILTKAQFDSLNGNIETFIGNHIGSIIGSIEIVDCVINHPSIWAERSYFNITSNPLPFNEEDEPDYIIYNWVLTNPIKFDNPIPCKGKLSFWESGIDVCHICGQPSESDNICERCDEYYCEKHKAHYNQFTQIDYNCCSECAK